MPDSQDPTSIYEPATDVEAPLTLLDGDTHATFVPVVAENLDRYHLTEELARGSFGIVFRAHDTHLERDVAIKILDPALSADPEIAPRFLREAETTARIRHPNIVTVLDWGQYVDCAYIVMELLDGESLTSRLATGGRIFHNEAVSIASQLADALAAAHAVGLLHRDLKPDNIFLIQDASMPCGVRVKLIDFGLAKELGAARRTGVLTMLGTPQYMSPEQSRCASVVDQRTDIYALGCVMFEMITGHPPYTGDVADLIDAHQRAPIPRPSEYLACSPELEQLIVAMLAKVPADRPPSMTAVRAALDDLPWERLGSAPGIPWRPQHHAVIRPAAQGPTLIQPMAIALPTVRPVWQSPPPTRPSATFLAIPPVRFVYFAIVGVVLGAILGAIV